jgi:hypothetical protein
VRAALSGVPVAAALLCGGPGDPILALRLAWAALAAAMFYFAWAVARGGVSRPPSSLVAVTAACAGLCSLTALLSAGGARLSGTWFPFAAATALIPGVALLTADDRRRVDQILAAAAWTLVIIAVHQRIHGHSRPAAFFSDEHAFAGAILLLSSFARRGGGFLTAGLLLCLYWTHSYAAWLALAAAALLSARRWSHALRVACEGAVILAAAAARLRAAIASPVDLPLLLAWCAPALQLLRRGDPAVRTGLIAFLIYGVRRDVASNPAVFLLFCLSAAWSIPESDDTFDVRPGRRPAVVAAATVAACLSFWAVRM